MGKLLANQIRGINPLAKKGVLLFWAFLLSFACLSVPQSADAAVTALQNWRTTGGTTGITATNYFRNTTTAPGATNTYAIAAGPNRLLVVALVINTSANQNTRIPTVKYGAAGTENKTLTLATSNQATSQRQHTWLFYLKEADIATANGTNLSFTYAGTAPTYQGVYANAAVYQNVDQTTPIATATTYSNSTLNNAIGPLPTSQVVATGDMLVEVIDAFNTASTTAPTLTFDTTPAATWTSIASTNRTATGYNALMRIATVATAGTFDSTHTVGGATAIDSMSAMTIKAGAVDSVKPTVTAFTVPASSTSTTIPITTFTATDDTGVTGYLVNESATPPAATAITLTSPPATYTAASEGTKTLYAWVKDLNGNVSNVYTSQSCTITLPPKPIRAVNWTSLYGAASYPAGNLPTAFTVPAGQNRLLVVAIAATRTTVGNQAVSNVTWGGKPLTLAAGNGTLATIWNHSYIYYLKEADIATATGTTMTATIANGTAYYTRIYAAVYTGVDQTNPISSTAFYENATANTTVGPFNPQLAVGVQEQAVQVVNLARDTVGTTGRTISAWATGWTTAGQAPAGIVTSGPCQQVYIRDRAVPTSAALNDSSQHTASGNTFDSYAAITIKAAGNGLTISTGSAVPAKNVYAGDTDVAVDAFNVVAAAADTITSITVTGSATTTSANVSAVRVYRKVGADSTIYQTGDLLVGTGTFTGNVATLTDLTNSTFTATEVANFIIVYDMASSATPNTTVTGNVTAMVATSISALTDTTAGSAILTVRATTTIGNGTEPATLRLYKGSVAMLDAFTLKQNGTTTTDDTITNVTVVLAPAGISGSGQTLSKISKVEIVNAAGTVSYGSLTVATTNDTWNIPTNGANPLVATSSETNYFVRITTAANIIPGFYSVSGTITSVVHSQSASKLVNLDTTSATHNIDTEIPIGPTTLTATTPPDADMPPGGGRINLSWNAASDPNGGSLHPTEAYILKRSAAGGTAPAAFCTDGTTAYLGNALTFNDSGLNDTQAPIYAYRVCAKDAQGNISSGTTKTASSSYTNYCNMTPAVSLGVEDPLKPGILQDQLVKSVGGDPFLLQVINNDIGTCPNVEFAISLVDISTTGGGADSTPPTVDDFIPTFPATVLLGRTAGPGGTNRTSATLNVFINAHETVEQIQKFKFKAQISAAGRGSATSLLATAILNDMPPIVHNSNNMAKFQYGTWGNEYTCATCHSNSTTNIKGVFDIISTPIGKRDVLFKRMSGNAQVIDAMSNDLRTNKNVSNNVCSVCHHRTRQHQYSASKLWGGPEGDAPYATDHYNNRDCVRCHTHNTAFKSILGVCGDCHGYKGTKFSPVSKITMVKVQTNALGTSPPSYGAHVAHNYAHMACAVCHSNTNHGLPTHEDWIGDDKMEIGFNISYLTYSGFNRNTPVVGGTFEGTQNLNFPYTWVAGPGTTVNLVPDYNASCNNYCHGGWAGNQGSTTKPNWVGTGQAACGTCHNATAVEPPVSGSHVTHAGNGATGLGRDCRTCHGTYTMAEYTGAKHINGNVQWDLKAVSAVAQYNGLNAGSTGALATDNSANYKTCTNMYCHSNVQGDNGIGAPTTYSEPKWGDATTVSCSSCHQYPNAAGGHLQHTSADEGVDFDCHVCHNNGGRTAPVNHADLKIDFEFAGLGESTVYSKGNSVTPGTGYGTCSTSHCHGDYTRVWGPATELAFCDKCHGSATSPRGFYDTTGPDGTLSIYSSGVGMHDIHIQNPNSPRKATFSRFTSFAAGMNCNQCHYNPDGPFSAGHIDNALPAEVGFAHMSTIAHNGDPFGYYSSPTYSFTNQTCSSVWCHGSGMQSNTAKGKYAGKTPYKPLTPNWNEPNLASGDPCLKCHAMPPAASNSNDAHWNVGANRPFNLTECVGCHQHLNTNSTGFTNKALHINGKIDGGCTGCHGDPPADPGIGTETGLARPAQNALPANTAGAHIAHMNNANIQKNCYTCHDTYNPVMLDDGTGLLEIGFNAFNGKSKGGTFYGYTNSVNGPKWFASNAETTITKVNGTTGQEANRCANLYCHGSTIISGTLKTPNWELTGQAECNTCHGGTNADVPFPAQIGAHTRHAGSTNLGLACETCHGQSAANMNHVDGVVVWDLDPANPKIGVTAIYRGLASGNTGALAPSNSYGTCDNFYCHSNVQGPGGSGPPSTYYSMTWGAGTALTCNSCHLSQVGTGTASHAAHTALYGGAASCGYCHHEGGDSTEKHADGMIYVNITTSKLGTGVYTGDNRVAGSAAGYGSCSNVICHGAATLAWGANLGTRQCTKCHGDKNTAYANLSGAQIAPGYNNVGIATDGTSAATARRVGAHQRHLISSVISSRIKCSECHVKVNNVLDNGHLNYTTATITFSGRGTGGSASRNTAGVVTCATTWCHTGKYNTGSTSVTWTDTAYVNETGTTVAACIACHAMPPGISAHSAVPAVLSTDALSTLTAKCASCHTNIKLSGITNVSTVFVNIAEHIDGTIQGGSCTGCHDTGGSGLGANRLAITPQFGAGYSHHYQPTSGTLDGKVCYACHWESDASGGTTASHAGTANAAIDLVIWSTTSRPITKTEGTTSVAYVSGGASTTAIAERAKINSHCIGCHSDINKTTQPFSASGDTKTPAQYAWDAQSIGAKWLSTTTTAWGKFTGNFTNSKNTQTKAFSAHNNAANNARGWNTLAENLQGTAAVSNFPNTSGGTAVPCFDCHNSHGSDVSDLVATTSYNSVIAKKGGILKRTTAGKGGYAVAYKPGAGGTTAEKNAHNAGAGLCFDCHNINNAGVTTISGSTTPWGYTTYGATLAILGYNDTPYFGKTGGVFPKTITYPFTAGTGSTGTFNAGRNMGTNAGGHYGVSAAMTTTPAKVIGGLCTPCHDPHGVSSTISTPANAVPLLKGTYVTSPYKVDVAGTAISRGGGSRAPQIPAGYVPGYHIDQNTMQTARSMKPTALKSSWLFTTSAKSLQTLTDVQSGGLCIDCHTKATINSTANATSTNWKQMTRVHNSVSGWATATGGNANNVRHAFTCSKCHTPHNARLPRLLVTNCLDVKHAGRVTSQGTFPQVTIAPQPTTSGGRGRFPGGGGGAANIVTATNPGPWYFGNTATGSAVPAAATTCHQSTTAGGTGVNATSQQWNTKSLW